MAPVLVLVVECQSSEKRQAPCLQRACQPFGPPICDLEHQDSKSSFQQFQTLSKHIKTTTKTTRRWVKTLSKHVKTPKITFCGGHLPCIILYSFFSKKTKKNVPRFFTLKRTIQKPRQLPPRPGPHAAARLRRRLIARRREGLSPAASRPKGGLGWCSIGFLRFLLWFFLGFYLRKRVS